jgi:hypothetical protein
VHPPGFARVGPPSTISTVLFLAPITIIIYFLRTNLSSKPQKNKGDEKEQDESKRKRIEEKYTIVDLLFRLYFLLNYLGVSIVYWAVISIST